MNPGNTVRCWTGRKWIYATVVTVRHGVVHTSAGGFPVRLVEPRGY